MLITVHSTGARRRWGIHWVPLQQTSNMLRRAFKISFAAISIFKPPTRYKNLLLSETRHTLSSTLHVSDVAEKSAIIAMWCQMDDKWCQMDDSTNNDKNEYGVRKVENQLVDDGVWLMDDLVGCVDIRRRYVRHRFTFGDDLGLSRWITENKQIPNPTLTHVFSSIITNEQNKFKTFKELALINGVKSHDPCVWSAPKVRPPASERRRI